LKRSFRLSGYASQSLACVAWAAIAADVFVMILEYVLDICINLSTARLLCCGGFGGFVYSEPTGLRYAPIVLAHPKRFAQSVALHFSQHPKASAAELLDAEHCGSVPTVAPHFVERGNLRFR
jgi:hypothetical protein